MLALAALLLLGQGDPVERLRVELVAANSATAVLQRRCAEPIRAVVGSGPAVPASAEQRARLKVAAEVPVAYRRVTLLCGHTPLSDAENWYVPGRLTDAMNAALASDTPFGAVIRPLAPHRQVIEVGSIVGDYILRCRALVIGGDGLPLAEVVELYTPAMRTLPTLR